MDIFYFTFFPFFPLFEYTYKPWLIVLQLYVHAYTHTDISTNTNCLRIFYIIPNGFIRKTLAAVCECERVLKEIYYMAGNKNV